MLIEIDSRSPAHVADTVTSQTRQPMLFGGRATCRARVWSPGSAAGDGWYVAVKTSCEAAAALVLIVLAAPVILLAAMLVKLTSAGPAFYTQTRVGRKGRLFTIYKLRTMVHDCESLTGPRWSIPGDPRVTWIGGILRLTHLDELPQLVNVLRGEMSLIGPRPERPEFIPDLDDAIPGYRARLSIRPGVTGLAQVNLPADTDLTSVSRKLAYDLYYIQHVGPWLDLGIMVCTVLYSLGVPFRVSRELLRLPRGEAVEHEVEPQQVERHRVAA